MIPVSLVLGLYTAFVAMCMWNWFATKAFHAARVTYLEMLGVVWFVRLLTHRTSSREDVRWARLYAAIDTLAPQEKKSAWGAVDSERQSGMLSVLAHATFDELARSTITLVLGFAVSRFL